MFCAKCGKEIHDEAVICPHCGCGVSNRSVAAPKVETPTLSLIAIIFAFLAPLVGLILGIIGLNVYKDETFRQKSKGAIFISLGMFIAYFFIGFVLGTMMA